MTYHPDEMGFFAVVEKPLEVLIKRLEELEKQRVVDSVRISRLEAEVISLRSKQPSVPVSTRRGGCLA